MVQNQIINYVLATKDYSLFVRNNLTADYFTNYADEYAFITEHFEKYGNTPDLATFLSKFTDFDILTVNESERYLVNTIREEYLYTRFVPVIQKAAELLKQDANTAAQYMQENMPLLQPHYDTPSIDIIHDTSRVQEFIERSKSNDKWCIPTGFEELDEVIGGWDTSEEFVVFFARTGQGKSWILTKTLQHAWKIGKNVGYISPEMSANKLAYRFDTLNNHFSNRGLLRGDTVEVPEAEYIEYTTQLKEHKNKFLVSTPVDFDKQITVSKLRKYIMINKLDMLAIDGITYLTDERYRRDDNKTTTLTNLSEDLMQLSCEMKIPILAVVQSNRNGAKEDGSATPELEDIRDSDGIAHNATKVISIRQKENNVILAIKKSRYGKVGDKLTYCWDINFGKFVWQADTDDSLSAERKLAQKQEFEAMYEPTGKIIF